MLSVLGIKISKVAAIGAALLLPILLPQAAIAQDMTAGTVMSQMKGADRFTYVAGIVEGLGHARYAKDGNKPGGRSCINRWFYDDKTTLDKIYAAFNRYPKAMPGQVVSTLANAKCGG